MTIGLNFLASVIANGAGSALTGLDESLFVDNERTAFEFMRGYYRQYRSVPDARTVQESTGIRIPAPRGDLAFHTNNLHDRRTFEYLRETYGAMRDAMGSRQPGPVIEALETGLRQVRASRRDTSMLDISQGMNLVTERLRAVAGQGGMSGIPTPWHTMNTVTAGYQNADLITYVGRMGTGKCMHPDTPVIMANGAVRAIKHVRVGDHLMGPDSQPREVLSTTTGREEMFKVVPEHGDEWVCNRSHILVLECTYDVDSVHRAGNRYLYSINEYLGLPSRVRANLRLVRTGVEMADREVEFDPYLVGLWLGDGSVGDTVISNPDREVYEYLQGAATTLGLRLAQHEQREGFCPQYRLAGVHGKRNALLDFVTSVGCYWRGEKRIHKDYLLNSREKRLQLLAGLVDSDGYREQDAYEITTVYAGLRDDLLYLVRSLGMRAGVTEKAVNGKPYYRVRFFGPTDAVPCKVARKQVHEVRVRRSNPLHSTFRVESQGEGDYFGITLPGDHLYLLGDFTVTHNTMNLLYQCDHSFREGQSNLFVTTEMNAEAIVRRWMAMNYGLDPQALKSGMISTYVMRRIERFVDELMGRERFRILPLGMGSSIAKIEQAIDELVPDAIWVDGSYLLKPSRTKPNNRTENMAYVFDELKQLTIDANRPVIVNTQFNRQAGARGREGTLENIAMSDVVGMHSSIVVAVKPGPTEDPHLSRELDILKGREGEGGSFPIHYRFKPTDLSEMTAEERAVLEGIAATDSDDDSEGFQWR